MQWVKVRDLVPGQTVAGDVSNLHGQVIMPAGTVMAPRLQSILMAWGIAEVSVEGEPPEGPNATPRTGEPDEEAPCHADDLSHPALAELLSIAARVKAKTADAAPGANGATTVRPPGVEPTLARLDPVWRPISAETVAQKAGALASPPAIYSQVERAINHPASSAVDIARVLGTDQALCARLLRIANSAFYGFPRRIEGIGEAVRIIGTRQLHDLVLATLVLSRFHHIDPHLVSMKSFWQHSLACAIASRAMANLRRKSNTERFFVAGLLHDIGSLVLYQHFPERAQAALSRHRHTSTALDEAERAIIGCDHGAVGAALVTAWKLPLFYREVTGNHHGVGDRPHTPGTAIVHLSDLLVLALGLGSNGEERLPQFSVSAWNLIGLDPVALARVAEQVMALMTDAQALFLPDEGDA